MTNDEPANRTARLLRRRVPFVRIGIALVAAASAASALASLAHL